MTRNKVQELEERLAKVQAQIAQERGVERRQAVALSAYSKMRQAMRDCLTDEERQAVDGMYLFLHGGGSLCVDLLRNVPSSTDKGQGKALEKVLAYGTEEAEAMEELAIVQ